MSSYDGGKTIDEKLTDMTEMLARIEERLIHQLDRVEKLEDRVEVVTKQVTLAHGGILVLGVLASIFAAFKSFFSDH